jgi:acetylornithine deacetylase/succinyl-diaminopimelate desuccinylase-like protein
LKVQILEEGVHSGAASGIIPSSFRIIRQLLDRVEDSATGKVLVPECWAEIPPEHVQSAKDVAKVLGKDARKFPLVKGAHRVNEDPVEYLLNSTWKPTISYTGADGIPAMGNAGNVLRPSTTLMLSVRLPPSVEPDKAFEGFKRILEKDVPYGGHLTLKQVKGGKGFVAPKMADWLHKSLMSSCNTFFKKPYLCVGEGGSIPFMGMLAEKFPGTQFVITGVLGPESNAHGPNEFLHIPMTKNLTCCVADVLADHYTQFHTGTKKRKHDE